MGSLTVVLKLFGWILDERMSGSKFYLLGQVAALVLDKPRGVLKKNRS